jgi:hypothetical protein
MKRGKLVTRLVNAVCAATNQTWPEDRHHFKCVRGAIESTLPKGAEVVVLTKAQADALSFYAAYALEHEVAGDFADLIGRRRATLVQAKDALRLNL